MSNFTDFDCLGRDPRVNLFYTNKPSEILDSNIIILPGTKNTIEDLIELKNYGIANAIVQAFKKGKSIIGICGGYQMLGNKIEDPLNVESTIKEISGLGILPVATTLQANKKVQQRTFLHLKSTTLCKGYEIHMGETMPENSASPLNNLDDNTPEGYYLNEKCWGTYLHGILDNAVVIDNLLAPYTDVKTEHFDYAAFKDIQYDKLAALIRENLDIAQIYKTITY